MKNFAKITVVLLVLGSMFLLCGWQGAGGRVRRGVVVSGVEVGGMPYARAEEEVRLRLRGKRKPLVVHAPAGDVTFPAETFDFRDNVSQLVRTARAGERLEAHAVCTWAGAEEALLAICRANARQPRDAELAVTAQGFSCTAEREGRACDYARLVRETQLALLAGRSEVTLHTFRVLPAVTRACLAARTQRLSSFTTYFSAANAARAHNVALAAARITGTELPAGGTFSFNAAVGARTRENGFREAKVIERGEFVDGVGGGVCQASTTLFIAALRAGLTVRESRPHSLSVSYVPPSLDAMVSQYSDLKLYNPYPVPVYFFARTQGGSVTFEVCGLPDGRRYETESRVLLRIAPPAEEIVEGREEKIVRAAREGIVSESALLVYDGEGRLLSRTRIRRDRYAAVQGIRQIVPPSGGGSGGGRGRTGRTHAIFFEKRAKMS